MFSASFRQGITTDTSGRLGVLGVGRGGRVLVWATVLIGWGRSASRFHGADAELMRL